MKQKDKLNKKLSGPEGFEQYYSQLYGGRWPTLRESLFMETDSVEYDAGGNEKYYLDSGSVRAAVSLPLFGAEHILDLCAAPGGKTLVLASCMEKDAVLLSNERSQDRKLRLAHVVENCLPDDIQSRVTVTCKDGAVMCQSRSNLEFFDRILLDAPCSSERHVVQDEKYLGEWSSSRIKTLSMAQWALLSSAWRMLVPGGYLLYSTCALAVDENDAVVEKLLKKFDDVVICQPEVVSDCTSFCNVEFEHGEETKYGRHILPDLCHGAGPLYFCLLKKNEKNTE